MTVVVPLTIILLVSEYSETMLFKSSSIVYVFRAIPFYLSEEVSLRLGIYDSSILHHPPFAGHGESIVYMAIYSKPLIYFVKTWTLMGWEAVKRKCFEIRRVY